MKYLSCMLLIIVSLALVVSGCGGGGGGGGAGTTSITGLVVDPDYNPLSGVSATLVGASNIATSNSDGTYNLGYVSNGDWVVTISKSGYTTSYRRISVTGSNVGVPLAILTPLDSKTAQIGPLGGTASNTDGSIKLDVPGGSLSGNANVSLTRVELFAAPYPPPAGEMFVAVIVYISPQGTAATAEISIPNVTGLADGATVEVWHFNTSTTWWWEKFPNSGGMASSATHTITAEVVNFGWIAAIVPYAPNSGDITGTISDASTFTPIPYASVWFSAFSTACDRNGVYNLYNVPTGTVTVEALAAGYSRGSSTKLLGAGETITANISLVPPAIGTITGFVYDNGPINSGIYRARVVAQPSGMETTTTTNGGYTLYNVPAIGDITVNAYASGYLSSSESGNLSPGATLPLNFYLALTSPATSFADDFETEKSWTKTSVDASCIWQRVHYPQNIRNMLAPTYVTLPDDGYLPTAESGDWAYWFGVTHEAVSWEGSYIGVQASDDTPESGGRTSPLVDIGGTLTSPSINLSNFAYAKLSFWTWWETECMNIATGFDRMSVEASTDNGTSWHVLGVLNPSRDPDQSQKKANLPYSSGGFNKPGAWVNHVYNLTPYVGNTIKVRFTFSAVDRLFNGFRGWLIDNVVITPEAVSGFDVSETAVERRPDKGRIRQLSR